MAKLLLTAGFVASMTVLAFAASLVDTPITPATIAVADIG